MESYPYQHLHWTSLENKLFYFLYLIRNLEKLRQGKTHSVNFIYQKQRKLWVIFFLVDKQTQTKSTSLIICWKVCFVFVKACLDCCIWVSNIQKPLYISTERIICHNTSRDEVKRQEEHVWHLCEAEWQRKHKLLGRLNHSVTFLYDRGSIYIKLNRYIWYLWAACCWRQH